MVEAILFGLVASSALLVGGTIGAFWRAPDLLVSMLLAFASGALISALAFELFEDAVEQGGHVYAGLGLLAGAAVFIGIDWLLERFKPEEETGWALLASVTLDGVPENLALGISLIGGGSPALLIAIFASNFPESLAGAADMRENRRSRTAIIGIWALTAVLLALAVVLGRGALKGAGDDTVALMLSFAGGAVLASLAATIMPEAFKRGHPEIAFATTAGFFVSYVVASG